MISAILREHLHLEARRLLDSFEDMQRFHVTGRDDSARKLLRPSRDACLLRYRAARGAEKKNFFSANAPALPGIHQPER